MIIKVFETQNNKKVLKYAKQSHAGIVTNFPHLSFYILVLIALSYYSKHMYISQETVFFTQKDIPVQI